MTHGWSTGLLPSKLLPFSGDCSTLGKDVFAHFRLDDHFPSKGFPLCLQVQQFHDLFCKKTIYLLSVQVNGSGLNYPPCDGAHTWRLPKSCPSACSPSPIRAYTVCFVTISFFWSGLHQLAHDNPCPKRAGGHSDTWKSFFGARMPLKSAVYFSESGQFFGLQNSHFWNRHHSVPNRGYVSIGKKKLKSSPIPSILKFLLCFIWSKLKGYEKFRTAQEAPGWPDWQACTILKMFPYLRANRLQLFCWSVFSIDLELLIIWLVCSLVLTLANDFFDFTLLINDKGGSGSAHVFSAIHVFFLPMYRYFSCTLLSSSAIRGKGNSCFSINFFVGFFGIGTDAQYHIPRFWRAL